MTRGPAAVFTSTSPLTALLVAQNFLCTVCEFVIPGNAFSFSFQKREIVFVDISRMYLQNYFETGVLYVYKRHAFRDLKDLSQILLLTVFEIFSCLWHFVLIDTSFIARSLVILRVDRDELQIN